jgi:hypothetical protein
MPNVASPSFQRAFVALSYVAGRRDSELLSAFPAPHEEARLVARRLTHPTRERRAEALALELSRVAAALEARRIK